MALCLLQRTGVEALPSLGARAKRHLTCDIRDAKVIDARMACEPGLQDEQLEKYCFFGLILGGLKRGMMNP